MRMPCMCAVLCLPAAGSNLCGTCVLLGGAAVVEVHLSAIVREHELQLPVLHGVSVYARQRGKIDRILRSVTTGHQGGSAEGDGQVAAIDFIGGSHLVTVGLDGCSTIL